LKAAFNQLYSQFKLCPRVFLQTDFTRRSALGERLMLAVLPYETHLFALDLTI
jgi:hypothetical protein